jgi:hypothetical protein
MSDVAYRAVLASPPPAAVGQPFDVALRVQDLRPPGVYSPIRNGVAYAQRPRPRGVFAAYLNLFWDQSLATVVSVQHATPYPNGRFYQQVYGGLLKCGAFAGSFSPLGSYEFEFARVRFLAQAAGEFELQLSAHNMGLYNTLVYAAPEVESQLILPEQISVAGVFVNIT